MVTDTYSTTLNPLLTVYILFTPIEDVFAGIVSLRSLRC